LELGLLQISSLAYLIASMAFAAHVARPGGRMGRVGAAALAAGFIAHTGGILARLYALGLLPVTTFGEGLSFFSWLVVGTFAVISGRYRLTVLGAVVSALAFSLSLAGVMLYDGGSVVPNALRSPWLPVHVTLAFLGNAVFAVAFAVSVVYLVQENLLKSRRPGWMITRLPSLEQLDRLNYSCLAWGFPILTLGMLSGGIWAVNAWGRFWSWEPRELLSLLTWSIYGGLLLYRLMSGLRGRRAASLTIIGFSLVVISYLSVNLLPIAGKHGGTFGS
jgi:cytochrome c-type biogenesis protein CcsB